jgi:rSAM/selenodomain-associated transferase 2
VLRLSVVIPVYNEGDFIENTLKRLIILSPYEIIVIDGGSIDNTLEIAKIYGCKIFSTMKGRGIQINEGVRNARGDIILVLHGDTLLSYDISLKDFFLEDDEVAGFFKLKYRSKNIFVKLVGFFANLRSKLHSLPYGDQAIFFKKEAGYKIGGFKEYPFLEDVDFILRIKKMGKIKKVNKYVFVSSRKLERHRGFYPIFHSLKNVFIVVLFFLGLSPHKLAKFYR